MLRRRRGVRGPTLLHSEAQSGIIVLRHAPNARIGMARGPWPRPLGCPISGLERRTGAGSSPNRLERRHLRCQRRRHRKEAADPRSRRGVRPGLVSRWHEDRLLTLRRASLPDRRDERRRHGSGGDHPGRQLCLRRGVVARRPSNCLHPMQRGLLRHLPHERRRRRRGTAHAWGAPRRAGSDVVARRAAHRLCGHRRHLRHERRWPGLDIGNGWPRRRQQPRLVARRPADRLRQLAGPVGRGHLPRRRKRRSDDQPHRQRAARFESVLVPGRSEDRLHAQAKPACAGATVRHGCRRKLPDESPRDR